MDEVLGEYATWMRSWGASPRTVTIRAQVAAGRVDAWGHPATWTPRQIEAWLGGEHLTSKWSRLTYHSCLRDFCAWAKAAGYAEEDPMADVKRGKTPRSVPKPLSDTEVGRILEVATGRPRAWVLLALYQGLRAHEVAKIRGEDVAERLYVRGKGDVEAFLPVHPEVRILSATQPAAGYWFPTRAGHVSSKTVSSTVGKVFRSVGVPGSIHRCRHTYGTRLLRQGADLRLVQELMRHASPATTAGYTQVLDDQLAEALNRLPGISEA
jgi:integrase/recombinase XerD